MTALQSNHVTLTHQKQLSNNAMKLIMTAILTMLILLGCSKSGRTAKLTAPPYNVVDVFTDADTMWIIHKNRRNGQNDIHKLIKQGGCFYEISGGDRRLMMSNENTRYAYTEDGNEYRVNISRMPNGHRVTNIFRTSPNNAGFLYSYHYTKDFKLLKIEVSDTVTYKRH